MNTFTDWDRALIDYTDDVCGLNKTQWREKIAKDTEQFLADGGEIEYLPYDPMPEIMARVGRWQAMGQTEMDEMLDVTDDETNVY
jgi:hypothetical protein